MKPPPEEHEGQRLGPGQFQRKRSRRRMPDGTVEVVRQSIIEVYRDEFGKMVVDEDEIYARTRCGCAPLGSNDFKQCFLCRENSCGKHVRDCFRCGFPTCVFSTCASSVEVEHGIIKNLTCRRCAKLQRRPAKRQNHVETYLRMLSR